MLDLRAAIWDVDGTLVDTAELHFQAWVAVCREHGRGFSREEFAATFGRRNAEIIGQLWGRRFGDDEAARLADRKEELYRAAASHGVALLPGARVLLEALRGAGFRQAVGSSAPRANLDLILRLTDTSHFFGAVVAMEDTQRGKPDPEVFTTAAARLAVPPGGCVVFEDAVAGVEAAHAGGMCCVAVRSGSHPRERLLQAGADLVVDSLEDVTAETVSDLVS